MPTLARASANRAVRRALPAKPGTRSAKVRPGQRPQRKRRTRTRHAAARSWNVRQRRPCTLLEAWPDTGQDASAAIVPAAAARPAASDVRLSTCRPAGTVGGEGFEIGIARVPGGHPARNAAIARTIPVTADCADEPRAGAECPSGCMGV
jgi:hypothetical protein